MAENVPKLMSETQSQDHKAHRTPMQINATEPMCKHIIFQLQNRESKTKNTAGGRGGEKKHVIYTDPGKNHIRLLENHGSKKKGSEMPRNRKGKPTKHHQPRTLNLEKKPTKRTKRHPQTEIETNSQ